MNIRHLSFIVGALGIFSNVFAAAPGAIKTTDDRETQKTGVTVTVTGEQLHKKSYNSIMEELFTTTPREIKEVQRRDKEIERAIYESIPPQSLTNIIEVSLKPGSTPPIIYVAPGHVSALTVIDSTGMPWPITNVLIGNVQDYTVEAVAAHEYKNLVAIIPKRQFGDTNLTMTLVKQPTPITLRLVSSGKRFHATPVIQIDGYGPFAKKPIFSEIALLEDDAVMKNVIFGIGPSNAERVVTTDGNVEAWRVGGNLFIRTNYKLVTPLPISTYNGTGGFSAYKVPFIPVASMRNKQGHRIKVKFSAQTYGEYK